jgi:hypothetical protein
MKKIALIVLLVLPVSLLAQNAKIKFDISRGIGDIDPKIYGVFMEPIHFSGKRMGLPDTVSFNTISADIISQSGDFDGKAEVSLMSANDLNEAFTLNKKDKYIPSVKEIKTEKNKAVCLFPAHSFTQIKNKKKKQIVN